MFSPSKSMIANRLRRLSFGPLSETKTILLSKYGPSPIMRSYTWSATLCAIRRIA